MAGRIAYYGNIVRDGLVLLLDAAKKDSYPGSGTLWRDISGNGNNGTLTNGPTFNSGNGGSIVFDGVNDTTDLGNILNIGLNSWTMSCWVRFISGSGTKGIVGKTSFRSNAGRYVFYMDGGFIVSLFQPLNNSSVQTSITPYLDGNFHNLTMTINRTSFHTMFIDGVVRGTPFDVSQSSNINLNTSTDKFFIGSYADGNGLSPFLFFDGNISQVSIYNRALTTAEVLQNYNATKNRYI